MSRIDYFLVSQDFMNKVDLTDIRPKFRSDHSQITMSLDFAEQKRGRGFWKFNNQHLKDKDFLDIINTTIVQTKYEVKNYNEIDLDIQWENMKEKLTKIAQQFAIKKAKMKNSLIEKFEQRILTLDRKVVQESDPAIIQKHLSAIKKTEEFLINEHDKKVEAAKFRTRYNYFTMGEKNSRYFFNLEKVRAN